MSIERRLARVLVVAALTVTAIVVNRLPIPGSSGSPAAQTPVPAALAQTGKTGNLPAKPLWIAVVREDNVLFPFALYHAGSWSNPWPSKDMELHYNAPDTTITTLSKVPATWYAPLTEIPRDWEKLTHAGYRGLVTVARPAAVNEYCFARWALVAKVLPHMISNHQEFQEFTAIALNNKYTEAIVDSLSSDSARGKALLALIAPVIDSLEVVKKLPMTTTTRKKTPVQFLSLYRARNASGGGFILYCEARKDYDVRIQTLLTTNEGSSFFCCWVSEDSQGKLHLLTNELSIIGWKPEYMRRPLGALVIDGRLNWFMIERGWEGFHTRCMRLVPKALVSSTKYPAGDADPDR